LKITSFWDFFFEAFPNVVKFIKEEKVPTTFVRNKKSGGSLLLRPEGQLLFATVYKEFEDAKKMNVFKKNVVKIDFNLNGLNWMYVFWKGDTMETKHKKLKKSIFRFLLGKKDDKKYITSELTKIYKDYNLIYKDNLKSVVA
jgi:alpha-mannosidase